MKVQMTESLQSIIIAVKSYRNWRYSYMFAKGEQSAEKTNRIEKETYGYFVQLDPKRVGLDTTSICYEAVLRYPIVETINTEAEDLPKMFSFGW